MQGCFSGFLSQCHKRKETRKYMLNIMIAAAVLLDLLTLHEAITINQQIEAHEINLKYG